MKTNPERLKEIKRLVKLGLDNAQIGRIMGVSREAIRQYKTRHNIVSPDLEKLYTR